MKFIIYLISLLLAAIILLQNLGGRYGSYAFISWCWLLISMAPLLIGIYRKKQFTYIHVVYEIVLVFIVFAQPAFSVHPGFVLAYSLIVIVPFIMYDCTRKYKLPEIQKSKLNIHVKEQCRELIGDNDYENCFNVLLNELENEEHKKAIIALKRRWSQNKQEKFKGTITNEVLGVQDSKIADDLLDFLSSE